MNKQDVATLKEALRAEYEKDMEAIERVEILLARRAVPDASAGGLPTNTEDESAVDGDESTLIDAVERAFIRFPQKRWTVGDLENQLQADGFQFKAIKPRSSIHTSLTRLEESSVIRIVKRGKGRKPNIYQYQSPPPQSAEPMLSVEIPMPEIQMRNGAPLPANER